MKKIATAASLLLGLSAATAGAQVLPDDMQGSDTLNDFMAGLTTDLGLTGIDPLFRYVGGGSGTGGTALRNPLNRQELAPMSRFLNSTECTDAQGIAGVRGCFIIGADAIAIYGNNDQACDTIAYDQTLDAVDLNGTAGIQGTASTTFADWKTALRILYFGQNDAANSVAEPLAVRCNSDLRRTLVSQWGNLFKGGCATGACPTGLKHAYRRDDVSGTTAVFLELLQITGSVPGGAVPAPQFCNGTETDDLDPIRRPCEGTGQNGNGDEVCRLFATPTDASVGDYNLGVVLPVLEIPNGFGQVDPTLGDLAVNCNSAGAGTFGDLPWTAFERAKYGPLCPNGAATRAGTCKFPKRSGSGTAFAGYGCVASAANKPAGSPAAFDGRMYNLFSRRSDGEMVTFTRGTTTPRANASYFRIEQRSGCQSADATDQIGCFASRQACSVGFAGQGVDLPAGSTPAQQIQEIGLRSKAAPFVNTLPNASDRLTYPLFRDLYVCRLDNFATTGSQPVAFINAQNALRTALEAADPATIRSRAAASGFFPTAPGTPLTFQGCTPP